MASVTQRIEEALKDPVMQERFGDGIKGIKESLFAIYQHESDLLKHIQADVEKEIRGNRANVPWRIFVAIVPKAEMNAMEERNFFRIGESEELGEEQISRSVFLRDQADITELDGEKIKIPEMGPYFLCCPYEEIRSLCSQEYVGQSAHGQFHYQLQTHARFIERERPISRIASRFSVNAPVIFSPYARRAIDILITDAVMPQDIPTLDFDFETNGLEKKVLSDYVLMWNVKVFPSKMCDSSIAPDGDERRIQYAYKTEDDVFILPDCNPDDDLQIDVRRKEGVTLLFAPEKLEMTKGVLYKIRKPDLEGALPPAVTIFQNMCRMSDRLFCKDRLRTRADVDYVLKMFEQEDFSCHFTGDVSNGLQVITRYEGKRNHAYMANRDNLLVREHLKQPVCQVVFNGDKRYLTDYANFVLHYLEERYPEFLWVGVSE